MKDRKTHPAVIAGRVLTAVTIIAAACAENASPTTGIDASENQSKPTEVFPDPGVETIPGETPTDNPTAETVPTATFDDFGQEKGSTTSIEEVKTFIGGKISQGENFWALPATEQEVIDIGGDPIPLRNAIDAEIIESGQSSIQKVLFRSTDGPGWVYSLTSVNGSLNTPFWSEVDGEFQPHQNVFPIDEESGEVQTDRWELKKAPPQLGEDQKYSKIPVFVEGLPFYLVLNKDTGEIEGILDQSTMTLSPYEATQAQPTEEVQEIADKLGENFRVEFIDDNFVIVENLTLQLDENQTAVKDVEVIKYSPDGNSMTIMLDGEEEVFSKEVGYKVVTGDQIGEGFEHKAGIQAPEGETERVYTHWGEWAKNKWETTSDGKIRYNEAELFGGLFEVNEDLVTMDDDREVPTSTLMWEKFLQGLYSLQFLAKNEDFINSYSTFDSFLEAANAGEKFSLEILEKESTGDSRFDARYATIRKSTDVSLNTIGIDILIESRENILENPSKKIPYFAFEQFKNDLGVYGDITARLKVSEINKNGNKILNFSFQRGRLIYTHEKVGNLLIDDELTLEDKSTSANQLLESWLYKGDMLLTANRRDFFNEWLPGLSEDELPVFFMQGIDSSEALFDWEDNPYLRLNTSIR